jgi:hypothetical protein
MTRFLLTLVFTSLLAISAAAGKMDGKDAEASSGQSSSSQPTQASPANQTPPGQPTPESVAPAETASGPSSGWPLDQFTEFSAVVTGSVFSQDERQSYIYRSGDLVRTSGPGPLGYMITNLKTSRSFGLTPKGCTSIGSKFFRVFPFDRSDPDGNRTFDRKEVGSETVDGHECRVEDVTVSQQGPIRPSKFRLWEAKDLNGFPVKIDYESANHRHSILHYSHVVVGPQDPTLFVYPEKCAPIATGETKQPSKKSPQGQGGKATANPSSN